MTIKNKILTALIAIPLALGAARGVQAEQMRQGDVFILDENGNPTKKLAPDTATAEIDVTDTAPYVATPAEAQSIETSQYEAQTPKQQKRNLNVLKNIKGPTLKEIVKQYEKEDKTLNLASVPVDVTYKANIGYEGNNSVYNSNGTKGTETIEGIGVNGEIKALYNNKKIEALDGLAAILTANYFNGSGTSNMVDQQYFIGLGKQGKNDLGMSTDVFFGWVYHNIKSNGAFDNFTWGDKRDMNGIAVKCDGNFNNHPVLNGLALQIFHAYENGTEKTDVECKDLNYKTSDEKPTSNVQTKIDILYNTKDGLSKYLNPKDNKVLDKFLNWDLINTLNWRDQMQNGDNYKTLDYTFKAEYKGLKFDNCSIVPYGAFTSSNQLAAPAGINVTSSNKTEAGVKVQFTPDGGKN